MSGWDNIRSSTRSQQGRSHSLNQREPSRTVTLGRVQPQAPAFRTIYCNDRDANFAHRYRGNSVSTTKYNFFTFLPKGLYEQFRRVANLYFLMVSILSATPYSPVHPVTNVVPLSLVLLVSLIKEAFEDWKRFQNDMAINSTPVDVLQDQRWESIPWKKLQVGDIIRVKQDGFFPADMLLLASTNADGVCYIETANLDGETNLKIRKALERTWDYVTPEKACEFKGEVLCEQPNNSLYTFTGNLVIDNQTLPLSPNQILLRGCSLKNTEFVVGVVIFTGHETKVMMNSMNVPSKRSTLERKLDKLILTLFGTLFTMCLIGAIGSGVFIDRKYYFLGLSKSVEDQFNPNRRFLVVLLTMLTLLTLYSTIIPISLYVSIEMVKFIQSTQFINKDLNMYHAETDTPALARTSNLNEELGQVEYIFSDKTGTLTRNLMEFFKCTIGGEIYGTGMTEIERGVAERKGIKVQEVPTSINSVREKGFNFDDVRLMRGAWRNEPNPEACKEFFRCLAICHTVLPEGDESPEKIKYQAASPDEAALVLAAKHFGFFFYRRTPTMIYVRESHVERMGKIQDVSYEILNVLEFNSTRKRQSVVCRYPDGRLVLYCKGADTVIYERLVGGSDDLKKVTREHLEIFGSAGLRTLCLAYKDLAPDVYESWNEKFIQAKSSLRDRERKLDEVAELIEKDLILIGATAIEDKLQEGVPDCIETLSRAGIKIWVLTGDKMETAINIAYDSILRQFSLESDGRWSYIRLCKVVTYFFYKNLTFTLTQFWFTFYTGFSGQRFYDDWFQSLYNVIFTALPVIIVGLFDKDVSSSLSKRYPELYKEGIKNMFFKWRVVAIWAFFAVYQSLVFYYFVTVSSSTSQGSSGKMFGLWDVSTMAFTCVVVTVNLRLLMICNSITRWHYISVGGSIVAWFLFIFLYSGIMTPYDRQENIFWVIYVLMSTFYFYITLLLVPVAALLGDFLYLGVQRWFFPYDYQIVQEIHKDEADDSGRTDLLGIYNQLTPDEARSYALSQLPRELSKHTGFAFDSPGYESFFASQLGVYAPQKAWDVARRASMRSKPKPKPNKIN
ncbi:hypothetical protein GOBAR_DD21582 [Gossypium barbadense]|nr:hypothetical protein GOBAR_DD21582 [Gossypium barbadense]